MSLKGAVDCRWKIQMAVAIYLKSTHIQILEMHWGWRKVRARCVQKFQHLNCAQKLLKKMWNRVISKFLTGIKSWGNIFELKRRAIIKPSKREDQVRPCIAKQWSVQGIVLFIVSLYSTGQVVKAVIGCFDMNNVSI